MTREELKTANVEKLISALEYCGRDSYYATYYVEVVNEITKRLKQIEQLKNQRQECERQYQERVNDIIELQEQIRKMKCCENCKYQFRDESGNFCGYEGISGVSGDCDKWELTERYLLKTKLENGLKS